MVKTIALKLQESSPLKYLIVCCSSCLVPHSIVNENDSVILQFNKVVDKLFKHQQLNNKKAGEAQLQSEEFLTNYVPSHSDKFNSCNVSMQHLVNFIVNFFIKMSSTNQCRKFFFSFLPYHLGKDKLKEVLV